MSDYLKQRMQHILDGRPGKVKPVYNIPKESQKRKKEKVVYRAQVKEIIEENPNCRINSPVCTGKAQGANHKQKRSPNNYTEKENLEGACNACNGYCETHPAWAEANGHQISRFKPLLNSTHD